VKEYVAAHSGRVEIVDSRERGAHFQIRLPVAPAVQSR